MPKTGKQIQGDVYKLLRDSTLYTMISGEVYRRGMRPRDSKKEDAVVSFTTGTPDQIETGVVTINLFVRDIDPYGDGVSVEDSQRTEELEKHAQEWVDSLSADISNYIFRLQQTIYTEAEPETNEHIVVIRLRYRYYGNEDGEITIPQGAAIDAYDTADDDGYQPLLVTEDNGIVEHTPINPKY